MKKSIKSLILLLVVAVMAFGMVGCGETISTEPETKGETPTQVSAGENDAQKEIEAYIATQREEIDETIKSYSEQGIDMKLYAEGSSLVYECSVGFTVPDDSIADIEKNLKESSDSELSDAADLIFGECAAVKEVVYAYYDASGTLLCKMTYER